MLQPHNGRLLYESTQDVEDYVSVEAAVTETRVVVNTVGSFWSYADHVAQCVDSLSF